MDAGPAEDSVADDMAAMGVKGFEPPEWMAEDEQQDEDFEVLPENMEAVQVFLACATQWQRDAGGRLVGLRYEGLDAVMKFLKVEDSADAFGRVRILESSALKEFRRQASRQAPAEVR